MIPLAGVIIFFWPKTWHNPFVGNGKLQPLVLEKYDTDSLMKRGGKASEIKIMGIAEDVERRKKETDKLKDL